MAFLNENLAAVLLVVLVLGIAAAIVAAVLLSRGAERRQARALGRLRHDSDRQAQALARLGENLNAAVRQIDALSGSMENRQDRMRRTLDERMELMNQANEHRLEQMQALVTDKLDGSVRTIELNGLFVAVGRVPENQNFANLVQLDDAGYAVAGEDCHTATPGVFVAGDNRVKTLRQLVTATADGAMAATEAVKFVNSL